jgi:hypothetical protein
VTASVYACVLVYSSRHRLWEKTRLVAAFLALSSISFVSMLGLPQLLDVCSFTLQRLSEEISWSDSIVGLLSKWGTISDSRASLSAFSHICRPTLESKWLCVHLKQASAMQDRNDGNRAQNENYSYDVFERIRMSRIGLYTRTDHHLWWELLCHPSHIPNNSIHMYLSKLETSLDLQLWRSSLVWKRILTRERRVTEWIMNYRPNIRSLICIDATFRDRPIASKVKLKSITSHRRGPTVHMLLCIPCQTSPKRMQSVSQRENDSSFIYRCDQLVNRSVWQTTDRISQA